MSPRYIAQVPASTSNCGPGFDTLGIALSLYNFVSVEACGGVGPQWRGEGPLPPRTLAMARDCAEALAATTGREVPAFAFDCWGEVPPARGLGSSATVRCGLLAGLNALLGAPLSRETLAGLAARLDGAADGVGATFFGGFCVSRMDPALGRYAGTVRFPVGEQVGFAAVSPAIEVNTPEARKVLPEALPFAEVTQTTASLAWMVAAFAQGRPELLRGAVLDYIHEPARMRLTPYVQETVTAGCAAGAWAGWLSGSGSTVVCVGPAERTSAVAQAMVAIYRRARIDARFFALRADNHGLTVRPE